jgi:hypothetical protein
VALRDSEFDEGISEVAEELLRSYTGNTPRALAIPVRQEACVLETFRQIIRVSFPDWTIWALPATGLEFWNVIAKAEEIPKLERQVADLPPREYERITPDLYQYLGDAFATYTVGPGYAMMAVALMLDPQMQPDHDRVRAVLAMLERMDAMKKGEEPYTQIRACLLAEWNAARTQLGQEPLALKLDDPEGNDQTDPGGAGLRQLIGILHRSLESGNSAGFTPEMWAEAEEWSQLLIEGRLDEIKVPLGAELRHVLNAAWLARINTQRTPEIPPTADTGLTRAVETLRAKLPGARR